MKKTNDEKKIILVLAAIAGLLVAALIGYWQSMPKDEGGSTSLIAVTNDTFGGPFSLTDQNGNTVTDKSFEDQYKLIYFGFTFCPAICPTELSKITVALNSLGDTANKIQPLFITVDPERDTVEKMKNYVNLFHPSLIGLTGSPEDIKGVLKEYKIYAAKVKDPNMTEYTVDHSSFVYLIAPDGRLLHIFRSSDSAGDMANIIGKWLAAH